MTTASRHRRRTRRAAPFRTAAACARVVVAVLTCAAATACPQSEPPSEACRVYLECFFTDGQSQYPEGTFDGGPFLNPDTGQVEQLEVDYAAFNQPATKRALNDAYGEDGYCWRKKLDPLTQDDLNTELHEQCTRACAQVLAADCERHAVFLSSGAGAPPTCLDSAVPGDDLSAHGTTLTCEDARALADSGPET